MTDGTVRIDLGFNTSTAVKDAEKLGRQVKKTIDNIDMNKADVKTLTFAKNLTTALNRMEKLRKEAEALANTKIPTEDYVYFSKEVQKATESLKRLQARQSALESDRKALRAREVRINEELIREQEHLEKISLSHDSDAIDNSRKRLKALQDEHLSVGKSVRSIDSQWEKLNGRISEAQAMIKDYRIALSDLEAKNEAFTSGRDTEAFKEKASSLNVLNMQNAILLERLKEINPAIVATAMHTRDETEAIKQETEAVKALGKEIRNTARLSAEGMTSGLVSRGPKIHKYHSYQEMYKAGGSLRRGPSLAGPTQFLRKGEIIWESKQEAQAQEELAEKTEEVSQATQRAAASTRAYGSVLGQVGKTVLGSLRGALNRLVNAFKQLSHHLHLSNKHHSGLMGNMKHSLSMILRYTLGIRSLFMLIRRLRSIVKEAFKVMAQEIPEVNEAISMLGTSFKQMKATFGTMLQPLLQSLAPVLNDLIQKVIALMNNLAKFFATLTGQDYVYQATVANYDYAKSVEEAEKANEGALASFDKLNVVQKENTKNTLALTKDTVKYEKVKIEPDEENWWVAFGKLLREGWQNINLTEAGEWFAEGIAGLLDHIPWESIKEKGKNGGKLAATFINGVTNPDELTGKAHLAVSMGSFIANLIQLGIDSLDAFVTTLDWGNLGQFLADAIDTLKTKLREGDSWKKAGQAFGRLFQGLVEFGIELFVKQDIFEGLGQDFADLLFAAIDKGLEINTETGNTYLKDFGIVLSNALISLLDEIIKFFDADDGRLGKAVNELFQGIDLFGIAKRMVVAFIKGFLKGLELLIQAGFGALGIQVDGKFAAFLAEALGLGILATKISGLVTAITGSGGTGGLLGAFKKKDDALDTQKKKLGKEKTAVNNLSDSLGNLTTVALPALLIALADTDKSLDNSKQKFEDLGTAGKQACDDIKTAAEDTTTKVPELFAEMNLKVNDIDTTAYKTFLTKTGMTLTTAAEMWNAFNASVKSPEVKLPEITNAGGTELGTGGSGRSDNRTETMLGWAAVSTIKGDSVKSWFDSIFKKDKDDNDKKGGGSSGGGGSYIKEVKGGKEDKKVSAAPYPELVAHNIEATQAYNESIMKANAQDLWNQIQSMPNQQLQEALMGAFLDAGKTLNHNSLNEILESPGAYGATWSLLLSNGAWDSLIQSAANGNLGTQKNPIVMPGSQNAVDENDFWSVFKKVSGWLGVVLGGAGASSTLSLPVIAGAFAKGTVIPPNKPFLGILGDQKSGTNVETPLSTIEQAVANVLSRMQIKNVFEVDGDPNKIFKVVQKQARIEYNQTGHSAFP